MFVRRSRRGRASGGTHSGAVAAVVVGVVGVVGGVVGVGGGVVGGVGSGRCCRTRSLKIAVHTPHQSMLQLLLFAPCASSPPTGRGTTTLPGHETMLQRVGSCTAFRRRHRGRREFSLFFFFEMPNVTDISEQSQSTIYKNPSQFRIDVTYQQIFDQHRHVRGLVHSPHHQMRREQTRDGQFRHVQRAVEVLQGVVVREWCCCQG